MVSSNYESTTNVEIYEGSIDRKKDEENELEIENYDIRKKKHKINSKWLTNLSAKGHAIKYSNILKERNIKHEIFEKEKEKMKEASESHECKVEKSKLIWA